MRFKNLSITSYRFLHAMSYSYSFFAKSFKNTFAIGISSLIIGQLRTYCAGKTTKNKKRNNEIMVDKARHWVRHPKIAVIDLIDLSNLDRIQEFGNHW